MHTSETPYTYVEYPKWVKTAEGLDVVVRSEAEEREATGAVADAPKRRGRARKQDTPPADGTES